MKEKRHALIRLLVRLSLRRQGYLNRRAPALSLLLLLVTLPATAQITPYPWSANDVGNVGIPGNASVSNGIFTVSGGGSDIWDTADSFLFVNQPVTGDGQGTQSVDQVVARVTSIQNTNVYAKAGVMFRQSLDPSATSVILDVKPDGGIELMARMSPGDVTTFLGGAFVESFPVSLKLTRVSGSVESLIVAYVMGAGDSGWTQIGFAAVPIAPTAFAGLAVTSHDPSTLNTSTFDQVQVITNLMLEGGFEGYSPPALGPPGWVSDNPLRVISAKSEFNQRHNGVKNGACWATTNDDCGMYQEAIAPVSGSYTLSIFANADRPGGLVGANVNGMTAASLSVPVLGFGNYGVAPLVMNFSAQAGDVIRVWMYSPATPGYVVIDDVVLAQDVTGK
jgi:hypothetical protein